MSSLVLLLAGVDACLEHPSRRTREATRASDTLKYDFISFTLLSFRNQSILYYNMILLQNQLDLPSHLT